MEVELPPQMDLSPPAFATGVGFTVITTVSLSVHEPTVAVTKYVVVVVGLTVGLALVEVNPLGDEVQA